MLIYVRRRAKLKRLTIDDQERIRRSRALPENFNFSQTLQPIFKETPPSYESALTDPLMLGPGMSQRPRLQLGTGHFSVASNRMDSTLTNIAPTLLSAAGSPNPSPVSSLNEEFEHSGPCFSATQYPLVTSPQFTNPFSRSHGLSASSPAFQRQGRPSSQNSMIELSGQVVATASPSNPSLVNNTYGDGDLPPLQFTRTPFQTRDCQRLGAIQTTEGFPHESGMSISQQCISPLSSPSTISYNQSQMHYPSSSGFRASSYYQSPDPNFWQESQISHPGYQHGQRLQPHRTTEQRPERRYSQSSFFQDPSVNRHDQRSYSHSGQYYSKTSSSAQAMNTESYGQTQRTILGKEAAIDIETQPRPDATRLRARSDTYPAYYKAQQ